MGFLEGHGRPFPQENVVIVSGLGTPEEKRTSSRAIIQSKSGQFNYETPIYDGDVVELEDPRGGLRQLHVREVNLVGGGQTGPFAAMSHISVKWGTPPKPNTPLPRTVVNIHGGSNQLAWDNRDVHQSQGSEWPTDLGEVLRRIIAEVGAVEISLDDKALLVEDSHAILESMESGEPSIKWKRPLSTIKGILGDIASGAGEGVGQSGVAWAQIALNALLGGS